MSGSVDFTTPAIAGKIVFSLVSEHVAWFGETVTLEASKGANCSLINAIC